MRLQGSAPPFSTLPPASAPGRRSYIEIETGFLTRSRAQRPRTWSCAIGRTWAWGEMFSNRDVRNGNKVCVIGDTIRKNLFPNVSPIGKEIRINNVSFEVVGVLRRKGANMMGMDQDNIVLAPWTTIKYRVSGTTLSNTNQSASASSGSSDTSGKSEQPEPSVSRMPRRSIWLGPPHSRPITRSLSGSPTSIRSWSRLSPTPKSARRSVRFGPPPRAPSHRSRRG